MRSGKSVSVGLTFLFCSALSLNAAPMHPVERRVRDVFPSVRVEASATFDATEEMVGRSVVSGLRARFPQASARPNMPGVSETAGSPRGAAAEPTLQVTWPRYYSDPLIATLGDQRVVLRAVSSRGAIAETAGGKVIYQDTYVSVDALEVPGNGRSEELLLLRDQRAPVGYDYEIVEMRGVGAVVMDGGAIRFLPDTTQIPSATQMAGGRFTQVPRMLQIDRPWVIDASGRRSETHAKWTVIGGEGATPRTLRLTVSSGGLSYPLVVDPSFSATGGLAIARSQHTATLLTNGKVLIVGGSGATVLSSAELYDPASGTFTATGSLATARAAHSATLLPNGKVLIAGGWDGSASTTSAELYDPAAGTFSPSAGNLATARRFHTATLLPNLKVLFVGGTGNGIGAASILASAELYDPTSGTFAATGSLATQRASHSATPLPNGKVLIAGGSNYGGYLTSAELYDPAGGTFGTTGPMGTARSQQTATLLATGKVLIAGGYANAYPTAAELYDPAGAGTFTATGPLVTGRRNHTATLLPSGKVLISGGADTNSTFTSSAELYDPVGGTFSATGSLAAARGYHATTLLANGRVLVVGGFNSVPFSSAELYDSANGVFAATAGSLTNARYYHSATLMPNGKVLIAGGFNGTLGYLTSGEVYDSATGFSVTGSMATARGLHTATLLPNGAVLVAGGLPSAAGASAELYDPTGGTFSATAGNLVSGRNQHTATLLANGKVLIAGGQSGGVARNSSELFDPAGGTFSAAATLSNARYAHTATLLLNGKVLIAGGYSGGALLSAELYDTATGTFSLTGSLATARYNHTATLLPNGKVLIAGGLGVGAGIPALSSAEVYDPLSGTFSPTGGLSVARYSHTATLLPNGKVLIAAGSGASSPPWLTAELYDPPSGTFSATGSLPATRGYQSATLLTNGQVLVAAGYNGAYLATAALYDPGLGFADARRPAVAFAPATLAQPAALSVTGGGFRGDSEASGGSVNSSPTNYPLLQLQRVDNDQMLFLSQGSAWSDSVFTSTTLSALPNGHYRVTVLTNGIPSLQRITVFSGVVAPATPSGFVATATSSSAVALSWTAVGEAAGYEVYRSSLNGPYALAISTSAASATDSGLSADTTYLYKVRAIGSGGPSAFTPIDPATTTIFIDPSLSGVLIQVVHIAQLRTAVNAMRAAAGLTAATFTDPTLTAGSTMIKQLHMTELRAALDTVRSTLLLAPIVYTDPTITVGSTVMKAAHVTELRAGTQ